MVSLFQSKENYTLSLCFVRVNLFKENGMHGTYAVAYRIYIKYIYCSVLVESYLLLRRSRREMKYNVKIVFMKAVYGHVIWV